MGFGQEIDLDAEREEGDRPSPILRITLRIVGCTLHVRELPSSIRAMVSLAEVRLTMVDDGRSLIAFWR